MDLEQAEAHFLMAEEANVRLRDEFPEDWADHQVEVGHLFLEMRRVDEAAARFRNSLQVFTERDYPFAFAHAMRCLRGCEQ